MNDAAHTTGNNAIEALRQDRDRWANTAMEQHQYIQQLEEKIIDLETQLSAYQIAEKESSMLPPENRYEPLVRWLEAEKALGNDYYADAGYNRSKMCRELLHIIGWEPNQDSLRKAQNKLNS